MTGLAANLSLVCWIDEDGKHVWTEHTCNGTTVREMLPYGRDYWMTGRFDDPTHNTDFDVTPSIVCDLCGMHTFGRVTPTTKNQRNNP
jgi:hypothetical protein